MQSIRVKVSVEVLCRHSNSGHVPAYPRLYKLLLRIGDGNDDTVSEFVNTITKSLDLGVETRVMSLRVQDYVVPLQQKVSVFRDNDRLKLVVMLDDKDEQGAALPNPQLASRNQSNRTTPFLKRKQPSSSCSSSDDSSDSGDDTSSSDSSMGLSKHSSGAKKRRATSSPRTTTTSNKGQSKPSAASDQTKPLKPGAVRGSDPLDAQYVWQMMIQQQRHDADGIHSSKPPVEAASTQSSSNMRSQVDAQRVVSTLTPNTSTNTPGNKKKNKMKQRKEAEGTPAASTNARPKEPFALVVAEKKRVGVPSYVPIVSASQLVAGDSIRYRQPVLEKAVPGLSDELEANVLHINASTITLQDVNKPETQTVDLCMLFDIHALRSQHTQLKSIADKETQEDGDVFEEEQADMFLDEFADLISAKRMQI